MASGYPACRYLSRLFSFSAANPSFEIRVAEIRQLREFPVPVHGMDIRERHPVERIVLAGGIDRHIPEHQAVTRLQFRRKAVIPDHVARQAGGTTV